MNEILKKVFKKSLVKTIFIALSVFLIMTFIVFPGLTAADTIVNIISSLIGIFVLVFIFYYIDGDKFVEAVIEAGETELDYINPEELKRKKKKVTKVEPKKTTKK